MVGITVDQSTIEKALVAHIMGDTLGDPEQRDAFLTDLITKIITAKEYGHDKDSLLEKHVKSALGKRINEVASELLSRPEATQQIEKMVQETLLGSDFVKTAMEGAAKMISAKFERGY